MKVFAFSIALFAQLLLTAINHASEHATRTSASAISITDDSGQTLTLEKSAQRIISLAPHLTEIVYFLGEEKKLVARDRASDYPKASQTLPDIGDIQGLDIESILSFKPDLILAWYSGNTQQQLVQLRQMGIPVYFSEPRDLHTVVSNMQALAKLTGTSKDKQAKIQAFQQEIDTVLQSVSKNDKKIRVFYPISRQPLMSLNGQHLVSDMIELCGGKNVFHDETVLAPVVNVESVIARNPQLIILDNNRAEQQSAWQQWRQIDAVRFNHFLYIEPDLLVRAGPRISLGLEKLCQGIKEVRQSLTTQSRVVP